MINIEDIIPFMKKGWVAMDKWGRWWWFKLKPKKVGVLWDEQPTDEDYCPLNSFDISPVEDWENSLRKVG